MTRWLGWGLLAAGVVTAAYLAELNPGPVDLALAPGRVVSLPLSVVLTGAMAFGAVAVGAVSVLAALRRAAAAVRARGTERRRTRRERRAEQLAESMLQMGDAAGARALLSDAIGQTGDELRLLPLLAEAAERGGDLTAATEAIERALQAQPDSPRLLRKLRDLHGRAEQWTRALAVAERLVTVVRTPAVLDDEIATMRGLRYQVALAEPEGRRGARMLLSLTREDPTFVPAWVSAGDRLQDTGRRLRARRAWRRGAAHVPDPVLLERLEAQDAAEGRTSRTTRLYRRLVRRHPEDETLRLLFVRHLLRIRATADATRVLDSGLVSPSADALRGELARLEGDFERASSAFARALAPTFVLGLAWRCTSCGQSEGAWHARCERCRRWNTLRTSSGLISTTS